MRATKEADEKSRQRERGEQTVPAPAGSAQGTQFTAGARDISSNGRISISSPYYLQI